MLELSAPTLYVTRDRAGQLNLLPPGNQNATKNIAINDRNDRAIAKKDSELQAQAALDATSAPAPAAKAAAKAAAGVPWNVQVARLAVHGGSINWLDETLSSPAKIRLRDLTINVSAVAMPFAAGAPLQFNGSLGLDPLAASATAPGKAELKPPMPKPASAPAPALITFKGSATDQAAQLTATVAAWPLNMAEKIYRPVSAAGAQWPARCAAGRQLEG